MDVDCQVVCAFCCLASFHHIHPPHVTRVPLVSTGGGRALGGAPYVSKRELQCVQCGIDMTRLRFFVASIFSCRYVLLHLHPSMHLPRAYNLSISLSCLCRFRYIVSFDIALSLSFFPPPSSPLSLMCVSPFHMEKNHSTPEHTILAHVLVVHNILIRHPVFNSCSRGRGRGRGAAAMAASSVSVPPPAASSSDGERLCPINFT